MMRQLRRRKRRSLAKDITLNALAQLGVFRFDANRCFVSIIDGETQHTFAETTKSVSLRDKNRHKSGDGIYLGARSLDLIWGVCPHTVSLFTGRTTNDIDTKSSNFHYDFVLMDISMPVMDGLVSTSKIREFEREHNVKPSCIMAVTGVSSAGFQHQATTAGIDNYLIKPLSLRALKTLMNIA